MLQQQQQQQPGQRSHRTYVPLKELNTHSRDGSVGGDQVPGVVGPSGAGFARAEEVGLAQTGGLHVAEASAVVAWRAVRAVRHVDRSWTDR